MSLKAVPDAESVTVTRYTAEADVPCGGFPVRTKVAVEVAALLTVNVLPDTNVQAYEYGGVPPVGKAVDEPKATPAPGKLSPLTLAAVTARVVVLDDPQSYERLMGRAVGTPAFGPVFDTHAPPRRKAPSGVPTGAPNSE